MILSSHSLATIGATLVAVALGLSWRYAGYSNDERLRGFCQSICEQGPERGGRPPTEDEVRSRRPSRWGYVWAAAGWLMLLCPSALLFLPQGTIWAQVAGIFLIPIGLVAFALGIVSLLIFVFRRRHRASGFLLGALSLSFAPLGAAIGDDYERAAIDSYARHRELHAGYPANLDSVAEDARSPLLRWMPAAMRPDIRCHGSSAADSALCVRRFVQLCRRRVVRLPERTASCLD